MQTPFATAPRADLVFHHLLGPFGRILPRDQARPDAGARPREEDGHSPMRPDMLTRLDPPLPLTTPKGESLCHFVIDYGVEHDLLWVCAVDATGECWTFRNRDIRFQKNITMGRVVGDTSMVGGE
jgi:hypothetical protein